MHNIVEAKLIDALGGRHDAEPITELLLLEILLRAAQQNQSPTLQFFHQPRRAADTKRTGISSNGPKTPGAQ